MLRSLFDTQLRLNARPDTPGDRVEHTGTVVRHLGSWNAVLWSQLSEDEADAEIAAQIAYFGEREFEWKLYDRDQPADLPERLRAAGFTAGEPETLMVADTARLACDATPPDGITLREVRDEADVDLMVEVGARAFGSTPTAQRERLLAELGSGVMVLAMAGTEPVCAARLSLHPGTDFAGLWGGGTVPGWRGRGLYRTLVAHRARIAAARGYRYVHVEALPTSAPILARLGFRALATTIPFTHAAT
ncbi:GNAT family N-acetyltransferase [Nonomuraea longicatena]|uniref:GNAT family N-acetyltransferase n=1 Tax=Nonomuraea longicatena TaxID=83682 RepID=A0ABP3ZCB0_9ACTN